MNIKSHNAQKGYASLAIGVFLLIVISLMGLYLSRTALVDIRTANSKVAYHTALAVAEGRLDQVIQDITTPGFVLPANNTLCQINDIDAIAFNAAVVGAWAVASNYSCTPILTEGGRTLAYVMRFVTPANPLQEELLYIVASGFDTTANAVANSVAVRQGIYLVSSSGSSGLGNAPPIMASGNVNLSGNFSLVTNPNGDGSGVPVSIWSKTPITFGSSNSSSASCQREDFERFASNNSAGECKSGDALSTASDRGPDIVDNDANFAGGDVFNYLFPGYSQSQWEEVKKLVPKATCNELGSKRGVVWLIPSGGSCSLDGDVGSRGNGVLLVTENTSLTINGGKTFYGAIFAFTGSSANAGDLQLNGGATVFGAVISNDPTQIGVNLNGTFNLVYDRETLEGLSSQIPIVTQTLRTVKLPGSWADFF